jgi:hypothetical protein
VTRDRVSDAAGLLYDDSHLPQPSITWPDAWRVFVLVLAALVVIFG